MADQQKIEKGTVYQNLNKLMNLDGLGFQKEQQMQEKQPKIIIRGNTPEEIHQKGLELEQKKELKNKFFRTTDRGFQKALQYEAARLPAYMDYEGMEFYPIISSALDLFMEEATTIGMNGKMLNIYSNKERIKFLLEDFFYNTINVNVNLPFWTRNLCKYGDNFTLLYGEKQKGITHVKQMVNYEIERFERVSEGKPLVKFKERMTGDEFNTFEVAHFRLLGDDRFIPYGSCLEENTLIKTNNGVKKIKDIIIGDIVVGFDVNTQTKVNSNVLDTICSGIKECFKISTKHNFIDASKEHKILIFDKNENKFRYEFVENLKVGDSLVINNFDENSVSKDVDKTEEHTIDRFKREFHYFKNIDCVPNSMTNEFAKFIGFMFGDGWISHGKDVEFALGEHESLNLKYIHLLEKFSGVNARLKKPFIGTNYEYSQVTIGSKMFAKILERLGFIGKFDTKYIPQWVFNSSKEIRESFLDGFVDADGSLFIDEWNCCRYAIEINNCELIHQLKYLVQSLGYKSGKITYRERAEKKQINGRTINSTGSYYFYFYKSINKQTKTKDISIRITDNYIIEQIISIENIGNKTVYDIHVDNENHNFYANNIVVHNSVLNKIRRVWRMLVLAEDAMLTYRIIRAGEKKVFKIDVGNIDEDDIEEYIYKVATKFKKTQQIDPNNGQMDFRFNILGNDEDYFIPVRNANVQTGVDTLAGACLALNTKISLLDGRSLALSEIINEFEQNKELWSYSINPENGLIVPGKITWAGVTRKNTEVVKITLDNCESITCTPDHKFPTKFNGKKEAKDLTVGESLWSFNKKFEKITSNKKMAKYDKDYEMIYDHSINDWIYTHRVVRDFMKSNNVDADFIFDEKHRDYAKTITHHKDFNRFNNSPNNLAFMSHVDHFRYHSNVAYSNLCNADQVERIKKLNAGLVIYLENLTDLEKQVISLNRSKNRKAKLKSLSSEEYKEYTDRTTKTINSEESRNRLRIIMQTPEYKEKMRLNGIKIRSNSEINARIKEKAKFTYDERLINYIIDFINEGDIRLESLVENINSNQNEFKKIFFELNGGKAHIKEFTVFSRKSILKLIRFFNYNDWKHFVASVPCYNHKIVSIEYLTDKQDTGTITIDGDHQYHDYHTFALSCGVFTFNSNLNDINDIEYLRENLFSGLGIPKPFLSFQDAAGGGKNMAQYDIRFAKKINRIQQALVQELNKMAMIHLYLLGYSADDISDFTLTLNNPSTQQDLQKAELLREKAQTYTELTRGESGIAAMSHTGAKRMLFNMSDGEIVEDLKQQKMEKVIMQELADSPITIKKTGLFADIDKRYGEGDGNTSLPAPSGGTQGGGMPPIGGGGEGMPPASGGGIPPAAPGLPNQSPADLPPITAGVEKSDKPMLSEEDYDKHVNNLVYGLNNNSNNTKKKTTNKKNKMLIKENNDLNTKLNEKADSLIEDIDKLISKSKDIDNQFIINEEVIDGGELYELTNLKID